MKTANVVVLACLVVAVGCGRPKPKPVVDAPAEVEIKLPERAPYRIAFGDILSIRFFYYPDYNINVVVRPDGMVTIPLVGEIQAEGMRPSELEDIIRSRYSEVVAEPEVSVIVAEFADQKIFVFGEVLDPGAYTIRGEMTLVDAIALAGGISYLGRKDSIILMRKSDNGSFVGRKIDVDAILSAKSGQHIYLIPGDIIYVPMTTIAKVDVFVDQFFLKLTPAWYFYIGGRETVNPRGQYLIGR